MPETTSHKKTFSKYQQIVTLNSSTNVENLKIVTTPSYVSDVYGLEKWRKGVGYMLELKSSKDKYKTYKIWYTGPIDNNILPKGIKSRKELTELQSKSMKYPGSLSNDARYMPDVDVIIVVAITPPTF